MLADGRIMATYDSNGVVVVRVSMGTMHRPNYSISANQSDNHGNAALLTGDWELFPNLQTATETDANYTPCDVCFSKNLRGVELNVASCAHNSMPT